MEVPKKEHGKIEVLEAKKKEIENLQKFGIFIETRTSARYARLVLVPPGGFVCEPICLMGP